MGIDRKNLPDCLFEISWEVCNKVGGIHTVLSTKSNEIAKRLENSHIYIGPDVWMDTDRNPEFNEDPILFRTWRVAAADEGLRIRVGRWNIPGNPVAILVDSSYLISKKDGIFTDLWNRFRLDSLTGQWDFIESALFGYAAGKVIESFVRFNLRPHHKAVAHFHEWMTGAGILYLKSVSARVATVFTTHATVLGRCLACNNVQLYESIADCNPEEKAKYFNVTARHSLEKCAAENADVFTTVSDITARECKAFLGKDVDIVTPNGFDNSIVPAGDALVSKRSEARERLVRLAGAMSGEDIHDALLVAISGRYEYRNKGIDVFLDALGKLNASGKDGRKIAAFVFVPSGHNGPDKALSARLGGEASDHTTNVTHNLSDPETDAVLVRLKALGISNRPGDRVSVFFVPSYLDGKDGILDMPYYDVLTGLDLTVFPSYYEPWGYTPLESLAFGVPTVTTSLSGFGLWVRERFTSERPSIDIIERNDSNYASVVDAVAARIDQASGQSGEDLAIYRENAVEVSSVALWKNNIEYYLRAYSAAIGKFVSVMGNFPESSLGTPAQYSRITVNRPSWSRVIVNRTIPDRLKYLDIISRNLWWSWNEEALELFRSINPDLWTACMKNPIALLDRLSLGDYKKMEQDAAFLERLDRVTSVFNAYMGAERSSAYPSIAYFSMEYGLDTSLKIYSGGLGMLAGDYLKEASDMGVRLTGVGLLYRYGYFKQVLSVQGDQVAEYEAQDFYKIPAMPVRDGNGKWVTVSIVFPGRTVYAKIWQVDVGRTKLYLLDTDFEDNLPEDRRITHHLYGGDWENRLKQELLLGIGGIRALRALGIDCDVYHCNEGHAAFTGLERLREYINGYNLSYGEALELVRSSSLFTTHTPVPAGHDAFSEEMLRTYINHYPQRLKTDWKTLMSLGKVNPDDGNEKFSMSNLACNLSQEVNGVSWMHGKVSRSILGSLWPGYLPEELHIGYVTNGVHYPTWTAPQWKAIHARVFGERFATHNYDRKCFEGIYKVSDGEIWDVRTELRQKLFASVRKRISDPAVTSHYSPRQMVMITETLRDDVLTIGFARRFATYKRAHLLFRDLDRLDSIVNNPERPVQFIFAGKAHPADKAGQDLIKRIIDISKMPRFIGKIVFLSNYDMNLAKTLVQGVDVWMNTPTRPLEASGTSGEKAVMNGVMHFSVLDGWWIEGYCKDAGWALPMEKTYDDQNFQDELDAASIYNILENEIAPMFYRRDAQSGLPKEWIRCIKNTVAKVACNFTTNRMLSDYMEKYYVPLGERHRKLAADDFAVAREIAFWKRNIRRGWQYIEVMDYTRPTDSRRQPMLGKELELKMELFIGDIAPEDIGVEMVWACQDAKGDYHVRDCFAFEFVGSGDGTAVYRCRMVPDATGVYYLSARVFAKNDLLPHRQDIELVRWL